MQKLTSLVDGNIQRNNLPVSVVCSILSFPIREFGVRKSFVKEVK